MANVDKPHGFVPVKHVDGSPYRGEVMYITPKDGVDIHIGDALTLDSGTADKAATNDSAFLGVCVGVGKLDPNTGFVAGYFNPGNLEEIWYDDSDHTNTDFVIAYVPARGMIFEGQSDADLDLSVGDTADIGDAGGGSAYGRSTMEIVASSNTDVTIVEIPQAPDNDPTSAYARYYFQFITTAFPQ